MFRFQPERLNTAVEIGSGAFGSVHPYQKNTSDNRWVVKFMNCQNFDKLSNVLQEIVLGFSCEHPYILPMRGYFIHPAKPVGWQVYIKMPRMIGDLRRIIKTHTTKNTPIPESDIIKYFHNLASAIEYLHNRRITHRDIKPENILLDSKGKIQLSDVGGAKFIGEEESLQIVSDVAGTSAYLAPELAEKQMLKKKNLHKTDLWSLGIVIAELCLLQRILPGTREGDIKRKIGGLKGKYNQVVIDLLMGLLKIKPETRKSAAEVRKTLEAHFGDVLQKENTEEIKLEDLPVKSAEPEGFFQSLTSFWNKDKPTKKTADTEEAKLDEMSSFLASSQKKKKEKWSEYLSLEPTGFDIKILNNGVKDSTLKDFFADLEKRLVENKLKNIQNISINLENSDKLTDQGIGTIANSLGTHFKTLKKLQINLTNCRQITDVGVSHLAFQIGSNISSLESFDLNARGCLLLTNQSVKDVAQYIPTNNKKIEHFGIHFYGCFHITDQGVIDICASIGNNLTKLSKLALTFSHCEKITDFAIRELASYIGPSCQGIQHLELNFVSCKHISDIGYNDMATQVIANLTNLYYLDFNFGVWDKYTDQGVKDGAAHVEANLKNLPHIGLNVRDCKKVTDQGINELMTQIGQSLKKLEYLGLNFSYCSKITDQSISSIGTNIGSNLKNLQKLDLNLSYCKHITDQGVKDLFAYIGANLTNLNHFGVNLWNCKQITDQGLKDLSIHIVNKLTHLSHLDVDFDCCHEVTDKGVQDLTSQIMTSLKNLNHLGLNFWNCPKITSQIKMSLKILLKSIPNLQIRY